MKIQIAVPTFETIMPETFKSIYDLDAHGHYVEFDFVKGYDVAKARNEIVKNAMDKKFDYVLMVDSDIILPKDALQLMTEDCPDICLGVYPRKNTKNGETELFKDNSKDFFDRFKYSEITGPLTERICRMEVKGGGFGCALVALSVFEKMAYPWFKFEAYKDFTALSEDLFFCDRAGKMGYKIWADIRVRCGHATRGFQYE